jgi:hypothetical protein
MKTIANSAALTLGLFSAAAMPVHAQDAPELSFYPSELMLCSYKDGMGRKDLDKVTAALNKWLKKTEASYTYYLLSPMYHEDDSEFDYGWVGSWDNGTSWGADYANWFDDDDGIGEMIAEVATCSQSLASTTPIHLPESGGPWESGVVWFQRCERDDDVSLSDAIAAHRTYSEAAAEMGEETASWVMMPTLGMGDPEFDYYHVQAWRGFAEIGKGFDNYFNNGGWKMESEVMEDIECASPNLYLFRLGGSGS